LASLHGRLIRAPYCMYELSLVRGWNRATRWSEYVVGLVVVCSVFGH
jgi:hypothetical protein